MTKLFGNNGVSRSKGRDAETSGQEKSRVLQELARGKTELKEFVDALNEALIDDQEQIYERGYIRAYTNAGEIDYDTVSEVKGAINDAKKDSQKLDQMITKLKSAKQPSDVGKVIDRIRSEVDKLWISQVIEI